jgi:Arc/MetJ family transcription regulator
MRLRWNFRVGTGGLPRYVRARIHNIMRFLHIWGSTMRTNIEIDDQLMRQAMRVTDLRTEKAVVEAALQLLVKTRSQAGLRDLRGKVKWEGDLSQSRLGRIAE